MTNCSLKILLGLIFFTFLYVQPGLTQTDEALRQEIEALKEGQKSIQKELQEIKKLIRSSRSPKEDPFKEVVIDVDGDPFQGEEKATLVMIEFSDYQ